VVDKTKVEQVVADAMAANADIEGIIICDAKGKVVFGHTLAGGIKHGDVAKLVVQIAASSSQLTAAADKGGLKEVSIASEHGFVIVLGDVKIVLAGIAGEGARESMGLLRMALRRALLKIVG
jgi:predicted regulator of Ras-like GTPase activity (Roadblock/LC7/MglB family)